MKRRNFLTGTAGLAAGVMLSGTAAASRLNTTKLYLVYATVNPEGVVLNEIFENINDALYFEKHHVHEQLRNHYSDAMADNESLTIGFSVLELHQLAEIQRR